MKIASLYSHLNGHEWMLVHRKPLMREIESALKAVDCEKCKTKVSKEKRTKGNTFYSPIDINKSIKKALGDLGGWNESRTSYWVTEDYDLIRRTLHLSAEEQKKTITAAGRKPIFSYNQTDFTKERVSIEVQLGKYSFIAYDLFVKHLAFYVGDMIDVGVEILPMKSMQAQMSSGVGYFEGALYDIARQGRGVPAVPLVLLGVVP